MKIIRECKNAGLPAPVFSYDQSGFRIEFKKVAGKSSGKSSEKSSEKIIEMIKSNSAVTIAELADHIGISTRAVEKQLAKLKDEKKVRRVGSPKGGHWKVIDDD